MKKDKLWAKNKIHEELDSWRNIEGGIDGDGIKYVLNIIDQLDEPEVLSQEWIEKNTCVNDHIWQEFVYVDDLENLLMPKQEVTYEDAIKVIAENIDTDEFSTGLYLEALSNNEKYEFLTEKWIESNTSPVDDEGRLYVWKRDLQNLIVPKQELPVIPKFVAEYLEFAKSDVSLMRVMELAYTRYELPKWEKEYDWISANDETFARAWVDDYEVEEQKYYVEINGHYLCRGATNLFLYERKPTMLEHIFTEQEIKAYDERFWPFAVKVEEMEG